MITGLQNDFSGGMDLFNNDTKLNENSYGLAFNVVNRDSSLIPLNKNLEDIKAPAGFKQGIYAFDKYLVLFNAGLCYYRNVDATEWTQIEDIFVNPLVDYIFTQAVPASTFNYKKVLEIPNKIDGSSVNTNVTVQPFKINTLNAGLVVQDGVSIGWFISPDAVATRLNRYSQWTLENRSYCPIMRNMCFINGILFGISPDKKRIYRSVSGRPIDFVVNVDINGNKGGDAETTAYATGYDDITCIKSLNSGELLIATERNCFPVEFNYEKTIFAEPTFLNRKPIFAGVTNQESFIDILGDYAFIDFDGLRSFNAVQFIMNEGRNSIFSLLISKVFNKIKQSFLTAATVFDNYAIFSVNTIYGNVLAIYDTLRQKWNSFITLEAPIKQFAIADQSENPTLYGITSSKVIKLFQSVSYMEARVRFKALNSGKSIPEIKLKNVRAVFDESNSTSQVIATEIVNNRVRKSVSATLAKTPPGITFPVMYPIAYFSSGVTDNIHFNFERLSKIGWKVAIELRWQNSAKLLLLETNADEITNETSLGQQATLYTQG
ncbi:MAG TPA: hypothetical protein VF849_01515 [Blattabacteriaceae bacterium]